LPFIHKKDLVKNFFMVYLLRQYDMKLNLTTTGMAGAWYLLLPQRKMKLFQGDPLVGVSYKQEFP